MASFDDDAAFARLFAELDGSGESGALGGAVVSADYTPAVCAPSSEDLCVQLELELLAAGGPGAVREALLQSRVSALRQARAALAVEHIR